MINDAGDCDQVVEEGLTCNTTRHNGRPDDSQSSSLMSLLGLSHLNVVASAKDCLGQCFPTF